MLEKDLLTQILGAGALSVSAQPVFEAESDGGLHIHYLECLVRGPKGTSVETSDVLFEYVRRKNRTAEMDRACITVILGAARSLPQDVRLGINVCASTLANDPEFVTLLGDLASAADILPSRLVLEITEHTPPPDPRALHNALECLRAIGVQVAVDDVGLGHSNYRMILDCRPDYLKIDRYFVNGCHTDFYRQAILASVTQVARKFGSRVVAEGVETDDDYTTVRQVGIDLAQGFLLERPHPLIVSPVEQRSEA